MIHKYISIYVFVCGIYIQATQSAGLLAMHTAEWVGSCKCLTVAVKKR